VLIRAFGPNIIRKKEALRRNDEVIKSAFGPLKY